jgi:hypothetical protein
MKAKEISKYRKIKIAIIAVFIVALFFGYFVLVRSLGL